MTRHRRAIVIASIVVLALLLAASPVVLAVGTGVIRGFAFDDLNGDGDRDPGESGVAGTVICLVGTEWCDHTEFGEYEFDRLDAGTYRVRLTTVATGYHTGGARTVRVTIEDDEIFRLEFPLEANGSSP